MPGQQLYDEAGAWAAFVVQAVLRGPRHLRSQVIDLAVHEVAFFKQLGQDLFGVTGAIKSRQTNFGAPPSGIWQCIDGRVDVAVHAPGQWDTFVELVGRPPVLADPIYRDRTMRVKLFDLLNEIVAGLLSTWRAADFVEAGQAAGLPCALAQTPGEFVLRQRSSVRRSLTTSCREVTGTFELPGAPYVASPPLIGFRRSAPRLGEHNEAVYVGELGRSPDELQRWRADGLI
jgi:formyl-CoA transferase